MASVLGLILIVVGLKEAFSDRCSCYSFHADGLTWPAARMSCQYYGGDLVSMETEQEWQAVKNLIQTRTNKFNDDWHIGLYMNGTDGNWTWVSGKPLLIDRWQPWQPRDGASFVVMAKNYPPGTRGLFNDVREDIFAGFVCEQSSDCSNNGRACRQVGKIVGPKVNTTQRRPALTSSSTSRVNNVSNWKKPTVMASLVKAQLPSGYVHWSVVVIPLACVVVLLLCAIGFLVWRLKLRTSRKENGEITENAVHYDLNARSIVSRNHREKKCGEANNKRVNFNVDEATTYHALQQKGGDNNGNKRVEYAALYKKPSNFPIPRRMAIRRKNSNELRNKYPLEREGNLSGEYAESCWTTPNERNNADLKPHEYHILTSDYGEPNLPSEKGNLGKMDCSDDELSYLEIIP